MNIDTVKAQENLDEPEKAFELDNVAVKEQVSMAIQKRRYSR